MRVAGAALPGLVLGADEQGAVDDAGLPPRQALDVGAVEELLWS